MKGVPDAPLHWKWRSSKAPTV